MGKYGKIIAALVLAAVITAAVCASMPAIRETKQDIERRREEAIKQSVLNAALQCYAVEGIYPDSLDYLEDHYGVLINHELYIVSYECAASNISPQVMVLKK